MSCFTSFSYSGRWIRIWFPASPMFVYAVISLLRLPMPAAIGTVSAFSVFVL